MPWSADNIQDKLQCILNAFDEEERIQILQAEEAEKIEAFAGIVTGPLYFFFRSIVVRTLLPLCKLFASHSLVKFTSPVCDNNRQVLKVHVNILNRYKTCATYENTILNKTDGNLRSPHPKWGMGKWCVLAFGEWGICCSILFCLRCSLLYVDKLLRNLMVEWYKKEPEGVRHDSYWEEL